MVEQRQPLFRYLTLVYTLRNRTMTIVVLAALVFVVTMYGIYKFCEQQDKARAAKIDRPPRR